MSLHNLKTVLSCALFGLALALGACDTEPRLSERAFDPTTGVLADAQLAQPGGLRLRTVSLEIGADGSTATYQIETLSGRRFLTTVSRSLERDGVEELVEVMDAQTGEVAAWTFDDTLLVQTAPDGAAGVAELVDDGEGAQITLPLEDGSELTIDYTGVAEDSAEEEERTAVLGLALLGMAPLDGDQIGALAASLEAADADLGATERGLGLKKLVKKIGKIFCSPTTEAVCGGLVIGGLVTSETGAGAAVALIGTACITVHEKVCK